MKNNYEKNLKAALKFVAKSETRPTLKGVMHTTNGQMVATDSHRLIIIENAHTGEHAGEIIDKDGSVIDGRYPDVDRIIPRGSKFSAKININKWLEVHAEIKKEYELSESKYLTVRMVSSENLPVTIQTVYNDLINAEHNINDSLGFDFKIAYNANYMIDSLRALKLLGYKECTIGFNDTHSAIVMSTDSVKILNLPVRLKKEPKKKTSDNNTESANTIDKMSYEMTKDEFIKTYINKFVKYEGKRVYAGVLIDNGIELFPLPKGSQFNGKLIRPANEILSDIHELIIKGRIKSFINGQLPNAVPWEKNVKPINEEILKDYPDLLEMQNKYINLSA